MDSPPLEKWLEPAIAPLDSWPTKTAEAKEIQKAEREQVISQNRFCGIENIRTIAGVDVGFEQQGAIARAADLRTRSCSRWRATAARAPRTAM